MELIKQLGSLERLISAIAIVTASFIPIGCETTKLQNSSPEYHQIDTKLERKTYKNLLKLTEKIKNPFEKYASEHYSVYFNKGNEKSGDCIDLEHRDWTVHSYDSGYVCMTYMKGGKKTGFSFDPRENEITSFSGDILIIYRKTGERWNKTLFNIAKATEKTTIEELPVVSNETANTEEVLRYLSLAQIVKEIYPYK